MVERFEEDTPFNKMKEIESLLRAPPFGEKENGSNGSLYLLLVTRISVRKNCVSHLRRLICQILRLCNQTSSTTFQPQAHHTAGPPLPQDSPQDVRSEDTLASPLIDSPKDVNSGESAFQSPKDVRSGDRPYAVRAPRTHGGKDVAVCYVTGHSTAQKDVQH